jgi:hypothetical protein
LKVEGRSYGRLVLILLVTLLFNLLLSQPEGEDELKIVSMLVEPSIFTEPHPECPLSRRGRDREGEPCSRLPPSQPPPSGRRRVGMKRLQSYVTK